MSGGSMEYLSYRVEEAEFRESTPLRRAFRKHIQKVAKALHEIEWADSGDTEADNEDERAALLACLHPGAELEQVKAEAKAVYVELGMLLARAGK